MYSSTFIFAKGQYDEDFFRLDEAIAEAAKQNSSLDIVATRSTAEVVGLV